MQHCQSSVKQDGLTLMAEQTQALKQKGRSTTTTYPRKELLFGHLFLVVVWPRI